MTIRVPDVPAPTARLCYAQKLDPPEAMARCDRREGHAGPHSWDLRMVDPPEVDADAQLLIGLLRSHGAPIAFVPGMTGALRIAQTLENADRLRAENARLTRERDSLRLQLRAHEDYIQRLEASVSTQEGPRG